MTLGITASHAERQVVTITFFNYKGLKKIWGMQQMQTARQPISQSPGLQFFKLLGSGEGFSLKPDFSTYGLLCVWSNLQVARNFFYESAIFEKFKKNTREHWTVYMHPVHSHGKWAGVAPFQVNKILLYTMNCWRSLPGLLYILNTYGNSGSMYLRQVQPYMPMTD